MPNNSELHFVNFYLITSHKYIFHRYMQYFHSRFEVSKFVLQPQEIEVRPTNKKLTLHFSAGLDVLVPLGETEYTHPELGYSVLL